MRGVIILIWVLTVVSRNHASDFTGLGGGYGGYSNGGLVPVGGGQGYGPGGLGYGGASGGLSRQGSRSKNVQVQETETETIHENEMEAVEGEEAIGGGSRVGQKSVTRTITRTKTTTINYQEEWKELYQEPLFQDICHLGSNAKSAIIAQRFSQNNQQYDYERAFSALYNRNNRFQKYMFAATGLQGAEYDSTKYFSFVKENPGSILRMVNLFAKHPIVFKNDLTDLIFSNTSDELLRLKYVQSNLFSTSYLIALTKSKTFRKLFSEVLNCDRKPANIRSRLTRAFQKNQTGTLLLVKHVITRRSLFSFKDYMSLNYGVYNSKRDYYGSKRFRHNTYFSKYFGMNRSLKRSGSARLLSMQGGKLKRMRSVLDFLDD